MKTMLVNAEEFNSINACVQSLAAYAREQGLGDADMKDTIRWAKAWKLVCEAANKYHDCERYTLDDDNGVTVEAQEFIDAVEELRAIHGDPNAPRPQGTINAGGK